MSAVAAAMPFRGLDRAWVIHVLDLALIFGGIILIPYDLPVIHQACVPLAALGLLLMILRGDAVPFLAFLRSLPVIAVLCGLFFIGAVFSIFGNVLPIMNNLFQDQSGWMRALSQCFLLAITLLFPFYYAFCLRRHDNWQILISRAAWLSLPIPLLVGFLQIANLFHVPGVAHLPWVGGSFQEGSFWRLTSVARESSWFGSFACVILPFLAWDTLRMKGIWKLGGVCVIATVLLFVLLGTSKSAYIAVAAEAGIAGLVYFLVWRPWRTVGLTVFATAVLATVLFASAIVTPSIFNRVAAPFLSKAMVLYEIFEPLISDNTKMISISTRFGMASAGIAMGEANPVAGVGLGQFGFHAYNYIPLWGLNGETLVWLSNDTKAWPSTSNLYARLIGEVGPLGSAPYLVFRLILLLMVAARLVRRDSSTWARDLCVFSAMTALVAFDFHRDSFINLDMWVALAMGMVCVQKDRLLPAGWATLLRARAMRAFLYAAPASFVLVLAVVLLAPQSHATSATLVPKGGGVMIGAGSANADTGAISSPSVMMYDSGAHRFQQLRGYWASTTVAARIIAHRPDLARAVLPGQTITPIVLAKYIEDNITVLMADKQTTMTLQYRNADPKLAKDFLTVAIEETDAALGAAATAGGAQADQLRRITLNANPDIGTRQALLTRAAAQELQSGFDAAGAHAGFDYIEHPGITPDLQSPQPLPSLLFAAGFALLAAMAAALSALLLPARSRQV